MQVNILEAKTELSKLIRLIETGREDQIIIARYGKPVAKMTVYNGSGSQRAACNPRMTLTDTMRKSPGCLEDRIYEFTA